MNIKEIFFYGLRLFIIFSNNEVKVWDKLEKDTRDNRNYYYKEIKDNKYSVVDNVLILSDNLKFNLDEIYNDSYLLFSNKYKDIINNDNIKIWNAKIINDNYIELHFKDKSIGIFYLKEFLDTNTIDNIISFDIYSNKIIINGLEIKSNIIYENCYKYTLRKYE